MRGRARARPSRPTGALNAGVRQPSPTSTNGIGRSTYRLTAVRPARAFMSPPPQRRPPPAPPAVNSDVQAYNYPAYSTGQYPAGAYRWQLQQNQHGGQAVRHPAAYHRAAGVYGRTDGRPPPRPTGARAGAGAVVTQQRSRKRSLSFTLSDTASVARSAADSCDTKRQKASDESPAKRARRVSDDVTAAGDAAACDGAGRLALEDINVDSLQPSLDHDVNQDIDKVPTYRAPSSSSAAALSMEEFSLDLPDFTAAATAKQNGGRGGGATSALNDHDVIQLIDSDDDGGDDRLSLDDSVVEGDEHDLELLRSISASGGDAGSSEADDSSSVDVTSRLGESALLYFMV